MKQNIVFQDNTSSIILEKNGKSSSSKQTKNIIVWYFWSKTKLLKKVEVQCSPMEIKQQQSIKFCEIQALLINCWVIYDVISQDAKAAHELTIMRKWPLSLGIVSSQECDERKDKHGLAVTDGWNMLVTPNKYFCWEREWTDYRLPMWKINGRKSCHTHCYCWFALVR